MGSLKNDSLARAQWGVAYDDIPKSVFAMLAWHLANRASGYADAPGAAEATAHAELAALRSAGLIPDVQATRAMKAMVEAFEPCLSAFVRDHPEDFPQDETVEA